MKRRAGGNSSHGEMGQERPPLVPLHVTQMYNIFTRTRTRTHVRIRTRVRTRVRVRTHTRTRTRTRTHTAFMQPPFPVFSLSFFNNYMVAFVTRG